MRNPALKTPNKTRPLAPLQAGQVWALKESEVHISQVGKKLVFYKHYKTGLKRAAVSLSAKPVLEEYLRDHTAVLLDS